MKTDAFYQKFSVFINAALIASYSSFGEEGFRQKNLKFFLELFTNWMETSFAGPGPEVQNTQISRTLSKLTEEGILKYSKESGHPLYSITSIGLLEIVTRLAGKNCQHELDSFFFLFHFVFSFLHLFLISHKN